jgi:hypothetical protein
VVAPTQQNTIADDESPAIGIRCVRGLAGRIGGTIGNESSGSGGVRFWILLAAVIGYHVEDVWDYLLIFRHYRPEYPGMVVQAIFCPGALLFGGLIGRLANALVYAVIAYVALLAINKIKRTRPQGFTPKISH